MNFIHLEFYFQVKTALSDITLKNQNKSSLIENANNRWIDF